MHINYKKRSNQTVWIALLVLFLGINTNQAAWAQVANPPLAAACGLDVVFVLDESGSIVGAGSAGNVAGEVRGGAEAMLTALAGTGSNVAVVEFNAEARTPIDYTPVTEDSIVLGGVFYDYLYDDTNNAFGETGDDDVYDPEDYNSPDFYTNWEAAFIEVTEVGLGPTGQPPLVVFFTDGNPTAYNDPAGTVGPGSVVIDTSGTIPLSEGAAAADEVQDDGSHVFVIGLNNPTVTPANVVAISGPTEFNGTNFAVADYTILDDPDELQAALRNIAFELCAPSLTITKIIDNGVDDPFVEEGWEFTADVDVPAAGGIDYTWITPSSATPGVPVVASTNSNGTINYQWEPDTSQSSKITIVETDASSFESVVCTSRTLDNPNATVTVNEPTSGTFEVEVIPNSITVCDVVNSESATLIRLAELSAAPGRNGTVVSWTTAAEVDNAGFNIYSSNSVDGPWTQLNGSLILANGSALDATDYTFTDSNGAAYYMLEDVDTKGETTQHGPISSSGNTNGLSDNTADLFLPLIY